MQGLDRIVVIFICVQAMVGSSTAYCHDCSRWSEWGSWSLCNASCGRGTIERHRRCEDGFVGEANGCGDDEDDDDDDSMEIADCLNKRCLLGSQGGQWTLWMNWSACSRTCVGGEKTQTRACLKEIAIGTTIVNECPGPDERTEVCNTTPCPTMGPPLVKGFKDWTPWDDWSECNGKCGARFRYRSCNHYNQKSARGCNGKATQVEHCGIASCPKRTTPLNPSPISKGSGTAKWTKWKPWTTCSKSCDIGKRYRYRDCKEGIYFQQPSWCGAEASTEDEQCNPQFCPGQTARKKAPVKIILGSWTVWDEWSRCSTSCWSGTKLRMRHCKDKRGNYAADCKGSHRGWDDCGSKECRAPVWNYGSAYKPTHVVGKWTPWEPWMKCSNRGKTCGSGGTRDRYRECMDGDKFGRRCPGEGAQRNVACDLDACDTPKPGQQTTYSERRQAWQEKQVKQPSLKQPSLSQPTGTWTTWASWYSCTKTCGGGTAVRYRSCKIGANHAGGCPGTHKETAECNEDACPSKKYGRTDAWSSWKEWRQCSASCDGGTRSRSRDCHDAQKNFAYGCLGKHKDTEDCGSTPCKSASSSAQTGGAKLPSTSNAIKSSSQSKSSSKQSSSGAVKAWTDWSEWSSCSATCNGGTHFRWRECNDANQNLASGCPGDYMNTEDCGSTPCKSGSSSAKTGGAKSPSTSNAFKSSSKSKSSSKQSSSGAVKAWTDWSEWSSCSATCNGGTHFRWRECTDANQNLAAGCPGDYMDTEDCGSTACQSSSRSSSSSHDLGGLNRGVKQEQGEEGAGEGEGGGGGGGGEVWGAWDSWQSCTVTCGVGVRMRSRHCAAISCLGDDVDSEDCFADELCEDGTAISEFQAEKGEGVIISCLGNWFVEDHPGSKVVWSKNEEPIEMNDRFVLVNIADLEIKRVEPDDEGVYVCSVLSGDKTFNRHVVLLKIHSNSGGSGSIMQIVIPATIPLAALIVIVSVVIFQRRSATKTNGGKPKKPKKAKVEKSKGAKSTETVLAEETEDEIPSGDDDDLEPVPDGPPPPTWAPPPPPPPPPPSMNNSNAANEWMADGLPPLPTEPAPPPPPPTETPPPPPTAAPPPPQHPPSRNTSNVGYDGVWAYSFSSWPPPIPP